MLSFLTSLILPRNCVGCGEALHGAAKKNEWEYLCPECAAGLRSVGEEGCVRCGVPVYGVITGKRICSVCREHPPAWNEARSLIRYVGPARGWVRGYKYHDARWVEREWAKLLKAPQFAWLQSWLAGSILVPVPLHPLKYFLRGFNQSETFCKLLLKTLKPEGAELCPKLLKRARWTKQQARLKRETRLQNVKGAFIFNDKYFDEKIKTAEIKERKIIVVDDLLTTGATMTVCVQALKKAGFGNVNVLAIARG
jgi:ComF family protein